jgi:tRNA(Ile)-lysidine synthase
MSEFLSKLRQSWPPPRWSEVTVLAAVSGGADSVALLLGLAEVRAAGPGRFVAAHFNHRLRGRESDQDQAFVEELARKLGVQCIVAAVPEGDLDAARGGQGLESAARQARYEFLSRAADHCGARYVATAHTADDQVETILHHILRGTGLAGLAGIPRTRPLTTAATLIRPLLSVTRQEVLDYLEQLGESWRDDSSNRLTDLTRNRIRLELLPRLEKDFNPQVRAALLRLGRLAEEADDWLSGQAMSLAASIARPISGGVEIDTQALHDSAELLARYVLIDIWRKRGWPMQDMSLEKWDQLLSLGRSAEITTKGTVQTYPGGIRAEKQAGVLRLTRPE